MSKNWTNIAVGDDQHVIPIDDWREHQLEVWCECNPSSEFETSGYLIIHLSFDGREHDEPDHVIKECQFCVDREINKYMKGKA